MHMHMKANNQIYLLGTNVEDAFSSCFDLKFLVFMFCFLLIFLLIFFLGGGGYFF